MIKQMKLKGKEWWGWLRTFVLARLGKGLLSLLMRTCTVNIEGLEAFCEIASKEKCILILWHNRIAPALYLFSRYTPYISYAALVSASRDGNLLDAVIHSYRNGSTIRVPHHSRYQALQEVIRCVEERKKIVVITPDGPRGPLYRLKPGVALAALETGARLVSFNWEAERYWEFGTWDKFRLPKPFTKISFTLDTTFCLQKENSVDKPNLQETMVAIEEFLNRPLSKLPLPGKIRAF